MLYTEIDGACVQINETELLAVDGGVNGWTTLGGIATVVAGIGLMAAALTPGLNVVAAATLVYSGTWGVAEGITISLLGIVTTK